MQLKFRPPVIGEDGKTLKLLAMDGDNPVLFVVPLPLLVECLRIAAPVEIMVGVAENLDKIRMACRAAHAAPRSTASDALIRVTREDFPSR